MSNNTKKRVAKKPGAAVAGKLAVAAKPERAVKTTVPMK